MQTKWQRDYGVRRTWANKMERQAQAIRDGDWDRVRQMDIEFARWADTKVRELTEA